jgi:hypothetical protein
MTLASLLCSQKIKNLELNHFGKIEQKAYKRE